jgi:hypothetical protein
MHGAFICKPFIYVRKMHEECSIYAGISLHESAKSSANGGKILRTSVIDSLVINEGGWGSPRGSQRATRIVRSAKTKGHTKGIVHEYCLILRKLDAMGEWRIPPRSHYDFSFSVR